MNQPISGCLAKHVLQHDPMDQKSRRRPEGNQVRQRIKFPAKRALHAAHARQAAVEQVKNARQQDEHQRQFDLRVKSGAGLAIGPIFASTILVSATNPQNKLPAVIKLGRK